jgi:hypothetical protein
MKIQRNVAGMVTAFEIGLGVLGILLCLGDPAAGALGDCPILVVLAAVTSNLPHLQPCSMGDCRPPCRYGALGRTERNPRLVSRFLFPAS